MKKAYYVLVALVVLAVVAVLLAKVAEQHAEIDAITAVYNQTVEGMGADMAGMYNTGYAAGYKDAQRELCPTEDGEGLDAECFQIIEEVATRFLQEKYP